MGKGNGTVSVQEKSFSSLMLGIPESEIVSKGVVSFPPTEFQIEEEQRGVATELEKLKAELAEQCAATVKAEGWRFEAEQQLVAERRKTQQQQRELEVLKAVNAQLKGDVKNRDKEIDRLEALRERLSQIAARYWGLPRWVRKAFRIAERRKLGQCVFGLNDE